MIFFSFFIISGSSTKYRTADFKRNEFRSECNALNWPCWNWLVNAKFCNTLLRIYSFAIFFFEIKKPILKWWEIRSSVGLLCFTSLMLIGWFRHVFVTDLLHYNKALKLYNFVWTLCLVMIDSRNCAVVLDWFYTQ